jgi:hypothetical protein
MIRLPFCMLGLLIGAVSVARADQAHAPYEQIAQNSAGSAGPVAVPGSSMSKPNPFPSSTGAGIPERKINEDEAYSTAVRDCRTLPNSQRAVCIDEVNKRFGQM